MIEQFQAAIAAEDDETAEALVGQMTDADQPALLHMAAHPDSEQVWWGVRALANVGDADAVPVLVTALQHREHTVRAAAALALGHVHSRAAAAVEAHLDALARLLGEEEHLVREAALNALALCGDAAVAVLGECLNKGSDGVRVRAAAALHRIGTRTAAIPLYHHLEDPNPLVRHHAYEALDELGLLTNLLLSR